MSTPKTKVKPKVPAATLGRSVKYVDSGGNKYAAIITGGVPGAASLTVFYPGRDRLTTKVVPHYSLAQPGQDCWTIS